MADCKYYIQDYQGNYYTPKKKKLIKAEDRSKAMSFDYLAGEMWLLTFNQKDTLRLVSEEEIAKKENNADFLCDENSTDEREQCIQQMDSIDWEEYLQEFIYICENLSVYLETLRKRESIQDRKISDILHYIELYEVSDEESVQLLKMLSNIRVERRTIKNRIFCIESMQRLFARSNMIDRAKNEQKSIAGMHCLKYAPRELQELFRHKNYKHGLEAEVWRIPISAKLEQTSEYLTNKRGKEKELKELFEQLKDSHYNLAQAYGFYQTLKNVLYSEIKGEDVLDEDVTNVAV